MIYKLHLTKEEIDFLSVAVAERQEIIKYSLKKGSIAERPSDSVDPFETPLSEAEKESMMQAQERSVVIAQKLNLLSAYVDLSLKTRAAAKKAKQQRTAYYQYALKGIPLSDLDPMEINLEIPDP